MGGLLGGAPAAHAAPPPPQGDDTARDGEAAHAPLPDVWPRPQSMRAQGEFVPVGREVTLVADEGADRYALDVVRSALREAGARTVRELHPGEHLRDTTGLVVYAGDVAAADALHALRVPAKGDLPAGGYRLAAGRVGQRDTVAFDSVDGAGLFHAAQTLRGLRTRHGRGTGFPGVTVRDWPVAPVRGISEGFYGTPWSQRERLEQLDFLGRTKQNRYLYAPGDDPYRQAAHWRDPYPAAQRADFRELAERARRNHVTLAWAVSPGQGFCFSSPEDRKALLKKVDAMRALGFGAFQLQFDDVSYSEWHCDADSDAYGGGPAAAAKAQAETADALARHLRERHPDAAPLSVLPTEFYQDGATEYRSALAGALDDRVQVAWTGVGVVPRTITGGELTRARAAFGGQPLLTQDNYPVNDYARDRVFLGPYRGREPAVAGGSAGLLANAMEHAVASRIPLFTSADYAWNPKGYRAADSWRAALGEAAGDGGRRAREAVLALAGNDSSSVLGGKESAYLRPLLREFWTAYEERAGGAGGERLRRAGSELRAAFGAVRTAREHAPDRLRAEVGPWLDQLARYGEAGERAVDMLLAQARGDGAAAWAAQLDVRRLHKDAQGHKATVGKGVLGPFAERALKEAEGWSGARGRGHGGTGTARAEPSGRGGHGPGAAVDGDPATAYEARKAPEADRSGPALSAVPGLPAQRAAGERGRSGGLTVPLRAARPLQAVTVQTGPHSGTRGDVEVHVPGEGWRRIGALSPSGWTQADAKGARADAMRLSWASGSEPPVVHEIAPWYADSPAASLGLSRTETAVPIGGATEVPATLRSEHPDDVSGRVTAKAPKGIEVKAPGHTAVPRGGEARVPLRVTVDSSVDSGSYRVPVSFGGERRTLTVHAFPRTGGPDLAREARASSSADETADFPASAVNDGRAGTRWSSPAEDGQWVQLALKRQARVGQVVLRWQDAYPERYRVQVSPDGRRWRTAAAVRDGKGGKESVRMDAPEDTRYVRVQGDRRATRFGISLWSVEVYAVAEDDSGR
ncbi:beta-N-acetylglucosaminidase domain-containing protein [Streptomyces sp. ODS28]|uniref:beta-N-acetylglucosaminidase domain-containing protein n=1 Tax=Streptomyces sp. ODS28 TaxID=3136688 RepID=UPI0031E6E0ED